MNRLRLTLGLLVAIILGISLLLSVRRSNSHVGRRSFSQRDTSKTDGANLAMLKPNQLLAKVGGVELRSEDLREMLENKFHVSVSHGGLSPEDVADKVGKAIDELIEDELLAQAGRQQGLKTDRKGSAGRKDLVHQYLVQYLAEQPALDEVQMRNFYKNHGEKFIIPPSVQVRELFLPLQRPRDKRNKTKDKAYGLGVELAGRIRKGESLESLAAQHLPEEQRDRAQVHEFRGAPMEAEDEKKVLALRPGEVLGPLRIEGGYSVFQGVMQVRSGRIPFYEAREKIKTYLEAQRLEEVRQRLVALQQEKPVQRFASDKTLVAVH